MKKSNRGVCSLLQSERLWHFIEQVIEALYPALLLLRLADQKSPAMDKLYYYVHQMDKTIKNSKAILNLSENLINEAIGDDHNISAKMIGYFLKTDIDQCILASTIDKEDMTGLDRNRNDQVPYENESDDDEDEEPGVLQDDISENSSLEGEDGKDESDYKFGDHIVEAWKKGVKNSVLI
jgi:hypothetical protein